MRVTSTERASDLLAVQRGGGVSGRSRESLREWREPLTGREEREAEDFLRSGEGAAAVPRCRVCTPASATQWEVVGDCTRKEEVHLDRETSYLQTQKWDT